MKKNVVAMVLVGGRGTRLENITKKTAKPAVSFGGKYKLIDFVLSNLSNSFIDTLGIITQYEPHELMSYIQRGSSWDLDVSDGGIHFLTPYTTSDGDMWQKGTAHAIKQHFHFIEQYTPDYVIVLSGDHVYKMDYSLMIEDHQKSGAPITIAAFKPSDDLSRYGILACDENHKITSFEEKPIHPKSDYASMGIYVFNTKTLHDLLHHQKEILIDFGKDIIPTALDEGISINTYLFEGYFRDVGTVQSLYEANMDLLDHPEYLKPHDYKTLPLYTRSKDLPPHHIASFHPVTDSLISDGCLILGRIEHSILSSGVIVKENAYIKDSLIYSNTTIGEGCIIHNAIVLEDTVILPNTTLDFESVTIVDNAFLWSLGGKNHEK